MMSGLFPYFAGVVVAATALVLCVVGIRRVLWRRVLAFALSVCLMAFVYTAYTELLGRSKPVEQEWLRNAAAEATVVASTYKEGKAIYVWLTFDGSYEPLAYALPWSEKAARALHKAQTQAKQNGGRVRIRNPFAKKKEKVKREIYAEPIPAPPAKHAHASNTGR